MLRKHLAVHFSICVSALCGSFNLILSISDFFYYSFPTGNHIALVIYPAFSKFAAVKAKFLLKLQVLSL